MAVRPTRFYSKKQESKVAKTVGGQRIPNSGATPFSKGDVTTDLILIECKTKVTPSNSMSVKKEWIDKNREEAFAMNRPYSAVAIDFGDGNNYYIIDEKLFRKLQEYLRGEEK